MDKPWTEIFRSKGSVYALEETTKDWVSRGTSGVVIVLQNPANHQDVRIKFEKNTQIIWWRLTSSRIKPKGERALVLKAWAVELNHQEILAIRFGDQQAAIQFAKKYHDIYPMAIADNMQIEHIFHRRCSALEPSAKSNGNDRLKRNQLPNSSALDDFAHHYSSSYNALNAARNHRMSNPPPAPSRFKKPPPPRDKDNGSLLYDRLLEDDINNNTINIQRHYSDPLPVQPQLQIKSDAKNNKRIVKALPGVRPPVFGSVAKANFKASGVNNPNENGNESGSNAISWKCEVCTYQNQESLLVCSMCGLPNRSQAGLAAHGQSALQALIPEDMMMDDDVYGGMDAQMMYDDAIQMESGDPMAGLNKWRCKACTFKNHEWMDRCEICSAKPQKEDLKLKGSGGARQAANKQEARVLHNAMSANINNNLSNVHHMETWSCPVCTLLNQGINARCEACNTVHKNEDDSGGNNDGGDGMAATDDPPNANSFDPSNSFNNNDYGSFINNDYGSFMPNPVAYSNDWDRMMHRGMGVSGNPYNVNLHFDYGGMGSDGSDDDELYDKKRGYFESTVEDFSRAASDIACYNGEPSNVFSTLRSVAKKLLKNDIRYRTLDTTNPKVMERLIGFEGVLDFLMLLGFESDAMGMKLICELKPSRNVVNNAISVLNSYQQRFRMTDSGANANYEAQLANNYAQFIDEEEEEEDSEEEHQTQGGALLEDIIKRQNDYKKKEKNQNVLELHQIVIWSTHENMQDNDTMETLVMTHKLFTDSLTLLKQLRSRFFVRIPKEISARGEADILEFQTGVQKRIQLKVIKALRDWMKHYWAEDFAKNEAVQNELREWLDELTSYNEAHDARGVCVWISKLNTAVYKEYTRLAEMNWDEILDKKLDLFGPYAAVDIEHFNLAKCTSEEIADQITLMDYAMFSCIEPRECVHQRWKDSNNKREAPNILSLIQQFNKFTIFIQIQILQEGSLRKRATAIKRIVKMGQHFKMTRNYNSLCAVFSALNSAPIHRLKLAWARVPERTRLAFQEWSVIFCRDFNHRNLRQLLRKAGGNPCIPHIGVFLQDLVFIDEGNKDEVELEAFNGNTMLNFNKCVRIADRIKNLQLFQHHKYNKIIQNKKIQKILLCEFEKLKDTTEDQIWDMSTQVKKQDQKEARQPAIAGFIKQHKNNNKQPDHHAIPAPVPAPAPIPIPIPMAAAPAPIPNNNKLIENNNNNNNNNNKAAIAAAAHIL